MKRAIEGAPWSEDEDATLRSLYCERGGAAALRAALPQRTIHAIRCRAKRLGLRAHNAARPWTAREDATLRIEWGEVAQRTLRQKLPGRSWVAIWSRAHHLGLGSPAQGRVSVTAAARACGYAYATFVQILRAEGVAIEHHPGGIRQAFQRACPRYLVDLDDCRDAVARYIARTSVDDGTESLLEAAARNWMSIHAMRNRLTRAGLITGEQRGHPLRLRPEDVDRAVRQWRPRPKGPRTAEGRERALAALLRARPNTSTEKVA